MNNIAFQLQKLLCMLLLLCMHHAASGAELLCFMRTVCVLIYALGLAL